MNAEHPNARHLELVLVLTVLEQAGQAITVDTLCERVSGERDEVERLLAELGRRGKIAREGEYVAKADGPNEWTVTSMPRGWKGTQR